MKLIIIFIITTLFSSSIAFAATTSSPSATPQTIDRIKDLVKENIEDTESTLQKNVLTSKAFGTTGIVKTVGTKNITIENDKDLLQVLVTNKTSITKANTEIKTSSVAINDKILVIGKKNKDDVLEAIIINVLPAEKPEEVVVSKTEIATINKIDLKKKTFTLTIDGKTIDFTLSKKNNVKLEDFKDGDIIFGVTKKYLGKYSLSRAVKI